MLILKNKNILISLGIIIVGTIIIFLWAFPYSEDNPFGMVDSCYIVTLLAAIILGIGAAGKALMSKDRLITSFIYCFIVTLNVYCAIIGIGYFFLTKEYLITPTPVIIFIAQFLSILLAYFFISKIFKQEKYNAELKASIEIINTIGN